MTKNQRIKHLETEVDELMRAIERTDNKINAVLSRHMRYFKHTKNTEEWAKLTDENTAKNEHYLLVPFKETK